MSFWTGAGSGAISALGNIAGGFMGAKSSASATNKAWKRQKYLMKYGPQMAVNAAKRAGLHPLAVLGMNPTPSAPQDIGTDYGLSQAGQSIASALARSKTQEEKAIVREKMLQEQEKTKKIGLENQLLSKQVEEFNQTKNPSLGTNPMGFTEEDIPLDNSVTIVPAQQTATKRAGVEAGKHALSQEFEDQHHRIRLGASQKASEPLESDWVSQGQNVVLRVKDYVTAAWFFWQPFGQAAKRHRSWLRSVRPKSDDPRYEYRYSVDFETWNRRPITKSGSRLYDVKPWHLMARYR